MPGGGFRYPVLPDEGNGLGADRGVDLRGLRRRPRIVRPQAALDRRPLARGLLGLGSL